jgi:hypothetical protein
MWRVWRRTEMHAGFRQRNRKKGDHLEDLDLEVRTILNLMSQKQDDRAGSGSFGLRIVDVLG